MKNNDLNNFVSIILDDKDDKREYMKNYNKAYIQMIGYNIKKFGINNINDIISLIKKYYL